jgi:hypothetical protein
MTSEDDLEPIHENHPLFTAAEDVFRSLHGFTCDRRAAAKITQLDRATTRLLVCVAEAIDLPWLRASRVLAALGCVVKLHALLRALLLDDAIEPVEHKRRRAALSAFMAALTAFSRSPSEPASEDRGAEPEPVAAVRTAIPAEMPAEEAALDSSGQQPRSGESGQNSDGLPQGDNGDAGAPKEPDPSGGT